MGLFDKLFKNKKVKPEGRPVEEDTAKDIDFTTLSKEDREKFIESQCEVVNECKKYIKEAKSEYGIVGSYFSDVQIIESMSEEDRGKIKDVAYRVAELSVDRRMYIAEEGKISPSRYRQMLKDEKVIVENLKKLQNNEVYLQAVKSDISALNAEKMSLKTMAKELVERQQMVRKITVIALFVFAVLFLVMAYIGYNSRNDDGITFLVVLLLAALFLAVDAVIYSNTIRETRLTERKLNKAITLLNKVKIKLFNTTNVVEYQYAKYNVKSAGELAEQYQMFLEVKKLKEKYRNATIELNELEQKLVNMLRNAGLFDANIWLNQAKALYDSKEMVEIRHNYAVRRQVLREQIEQSKAKASSALAILEEVENEYPQYAGEVKNAKLKYNIKL